jgi:hypothetical protein
MGPGAGARSHRLAGSTAAGSALLLVALVALISFGLAGVGRSGPSNLDANFFVAAGTAWRQGLNPYDRSTFERVSRSIPALEEVRDLVGRGAPDIRGFSYPPNIALLSIALSIVPRSAVALVVTLVNLIATAGIAIFTLRLSRRDEDSSLDESSRWVVPALVLGNSFTTHVLWIGQTTLFATACLVAGWSYRSIPRRRALAGFLFALAAIKPQVAILPLVWLLLERDWRLWFAIAASTLLLVSVPLVQLGPVVLTRDWLDSLTLYDSLGSLQGDVNSAGFQNMFGIRHLLVASGVDTPSLAAIALLATVGVWAVRRALSDLDVLGLVLAISALFVYVHDYDLAMLAPFYAALWTSSRGSDLKTAVVSLAFAMLFFPQRVLRGRVPSGVLHWRELVLLAAVGWFCASRFTRAPGAHSHSAGPSHKVVG